MSLGQIINTSTLSPTFDDEFNSFSASADGSTGLWRTTLANGNRTLGSNGEQEYYSDSSVGVNPFSIQNGVLDIAATPGQNPLGLPYNSGAITTQASFNQLYGYFEIDAKMPAGQGLWPAFWLLPASGAWPPELDAFEVLGNDPTTLYFSTHSTVQATQGTTLAVANVSAGFNLYGVMWGPTTVDLYINNIHVASMPTPADMNVPMYMLANLAVGGYWPGDPNSSTVFPANMLINYVRAYAYPGTTGGTVYDTLPSQNIGAAAVAPVIALPAGIHVATGVATTVEGVSIAANWPGGDFTVQMSDTQGLLRTNDTADVFTSGEGTTALKLTGNLAAINSALSTLTYQGSAVGSEEVWISATDPQGLQTLESVVATDVGNTPPVVTPPVVTPPVVTPPAGTTPVVTAPSTITLSASTSDALPGISVADSQTSGNFTVVVSDSRGLLNVGATSGVTETGEKTTSLTLVGSLTAVNVALATLTYQATSAVGADWLWISADNGSGTKGISHEVVTVAAAPVVSIPVVTTPSNYSITAGLTRALPGINVTDSQPGGKLTVSVSDSTGLLHTNASNGVTEQGENSKTLRLSGSVAAINAELASLTYQASAVTGADWLWVSADDTQGDQGIGHVVVNVTPPPVVVVPVLPVVHMPASFAIVEGSTEALAGISVTDSQASGALTVRVSDSTGLLGTRATSGVTVQGEGTTAVALTGSVTAINAELTSLTYQASEATGPDWLWVSANDTQGDQGIGHVVVNVASPPVVAASVMHVTAVAVAPSSGTVSLTGVMLHLPNSATFVTARLSDHLGLLATTGEFGVTATGEGSMNLVLKGIASAVTAELATLTYTGSVGHASAGSTDALTIDIRAAMGGHLTSVLPLLNGHLSG